LTFFGKQLPKIVTLWTHIQRHRSRDSLKTTATLSGSAQAVMTRVKVLTHNALTQDAIKITFQNKWADHILR
jgi:hypothetical protein